MREVRRPQERKDMDGNTEQNTSKHFVIAKVGGVDYLTTVDAVSSIGAEHAVLALGADVRHRFTVEAAQAFDRDEAKTYCFVDMAMDATPVAFPELARIIRRANEVAKARAEAEDAQKEIERLMKELAEVRARRDEALKVVNGVA